MNDAAEEFKIVFTGPMGGGKTTALAAISDVEPVRTEVANTDRFGHEKAFTTVGIDFGRIDTNQIVVIALIAVFLVGVAVAVIFGVRRLRNKVLAPIRRAAVTVWAAIRTPSRLALLIGGNVVAQCLYAASLLCCLAAFGGHVNFWTLLALNIGISVIASLVPVPGGGTAVSAGNCQ